MELNKYCKEKLNFRRKEALNATDATKDFRTAWLKG
jgi:hypothetical protein